MKKIVVIEDEAISAGRIIRLIHDYDENIEIIGPLMTIEEVENFLSSDIDTQYDLIISDIRLGSHTVFEAFEFHLLKSLVIFTTAYDQYAMNAIKSNGIEYLLKPITAKALFEALEKIKRLIPGEISMLSVKSLAHDMGAWRTRLVVSKGDELIPLKTDSISCIHREDRQVLAYTSDGTSYVMQESMSDLEDMLDPEMFFRINRQYIVNINYITRISLFFGAKLIVRIKGGPEDRIIISKDKASKLKEWLAR